LNGKLSLAIQSGTEAPTWQSTVYEHRKLSDKKASLKMGWPPRDVKIVQGIGRHWKSLHNGRQHLEPQIAEQVRRRELDSISLLRQRGCLG
jgi:hypothetical protein